MQVQFVVKTAMDWSLRQQSATNLLSQKIV
jgi:hypothetical protein